MASSSNASDSRLAEAHEGRLDALVRLDAREAYFWLLVANDAGHARALEEIERLETAEVFDEDGYEQTEVRFRLAQAYLVGDEGLAIDLLHAQSHLEIVFEGPLPYDDVRARYVDPLAARVRGEARELIDAVVAMEPFRAVRRRIDRLEKLWLLEAPEVIVADEVARLRAEAEVVARAVAAPRQSS